ncbi:MAG: LURP-one-related/scramblase family protein [Acutalibacteraceae bacterium]
MKLLFKQRFFSWFDSYDIYYENGTVAYKVEGRPSWSHELHVYDSAGNLAAILKERLFKFFEPTFDVSFPDGRVFSIKKELTFFKPVFTVDLCSWRVEGDFLQWDYSIVNASGYTVATLSKQIFNFTDTYVIEVANRNDALLALLVALAIDAQKCSSNS